MRHITISEREFQNIVQQYEKLVFGVCLAFTKNYFDAEDLAQETFFHAYKAYERFDGQNIKAWLTKIAANQCKNYLCSSARKTDAIPNEKLEVLPSSHATPEETAIEQELLTKAAALCKKLHEPYQTVAVKYFCENIKLSEYAKESGTALKTLQTQMYRAKKQLSALWKEEFDDI